MPLLNFKNYDAKFYKNNQRTIYGKYLYRQSALTEIDGLNMIQSFYVLKF